MVRTVATAIAGLLAFLAITAASPQPWQQDHRRPDGRAADRPEARTQRPLRPSTATPMPNPTGWHVDCRRPGRPFCRPDVEVAVLDSDGDGVPDDLDQCPGTPLGVRVDARGCPLYEEEEVLIDTGTLALENIEFELNSAVLLPESYPVLDRVGEVLSAWPQLEVEIGGHTDNWGEEDYNLDLSRRRAAAVRAYLVERFPDIQGDQITAVGYGESRPVAPNDTEEGRAQNRRVEFTVMNVEVLRR